MKKSRYPPEQVALARHHAEGGGVRPAQRVGQRVIIRVGCRNRVSYAGVRG